MLKPTHKAIKEYYRQRDALARQHVMHEMGIRSAFQMLLQQTAPKYGWTLVTEETLLKQRDLHRVKKMRLVKVPGGSGDPPRRDMPRELVINDSITITGIPAEAFEYRLGNRSALEWVVDQYQIKTDKRSGIESDPNRDDDPEYIVRLVGQVIRVSLETVKIVKNLPDAFRDTRREAAAVGE